MGAHVCMVIRDTNMFIHSYSLIHKCAVHVYKQEHVTHKDTALEGLCSVIVGISFLLYEYFYSNKPLCRLR